MNKKIATEIAIGVVLIVAILIGGLIWMGSKNGGVAQQSGQTNNKQPESGILGELDKQKQEAIQKYKDAKLKATIIDIGLELENWYEANKSSYLGFTENKANSDKLNNIMAAIKNEGRMEAEYNIYTTKSDYVLKLKAKGDNNFYCTNFELLSKQAPQMFQPIAISGDNFTSKNNCDNTPLK